MQQSHLTQNNDVFIHVEKRIETSMKLLIIFTNYFYTCIIDWNLNSEYHASDPLHACIYILCLHSAVSHEYTFITNILHKKMQHFTRYNDLLRFKEEIVVFQ
jgi:hypothetical protein